MGQGERLSITANFCKVCHMNEMESFIFRLAKKKDLEFISKLSAQVSRCFFGFGENNQATDWSVESVKDMEFAFAIGLSKRMETFITSPVVLGRKACRFGAHHDLVIVEKNQFADGHSLVYLLIISVILVVWLLVDLAAGLSFVEQRRPH